MKKMLFLFLVLLPVIVNSQVVTFAKTLPQKAFSAGGAGIFNGETFAFSGEGPSVYFHGGYGVLYSLDLNLKYIYYVNGPDYVGADAQYLFYETRKSYFSVIGGLHKWENFGVDLTGIYTYAARYWLNFTVGLDMDLSFASDLAPRFWLPVNAGFNAGERIFVYLEYNLPMSERAWNILAVGANYIIR